MAIKRSAVRQPLAIRVNRSERAALRAAARASRMELATYVREAALGAGTLPVVSPPASAEASPRSLTAERSRTAAPDDGRLDRAPAFIKAA